MKREEEMDEKKTRRSSILKATRSPARNPLEDLNLAQLPGEDTKKILFNKRVSFADTHQITEFVNASKESESSEVCPTHSLIDGTGNVFISAAEGYTCLEPVSMEIDTMNQTFLGTSNRSVDDDNRTRYFTRSDDMMMDSTCREDDLDKENQTCLGKRDLTHLNYTSASMQETQVVDTSIHSFYALNATNLSTLDMSFTQPIKNTVDFNDLQKDLDQEEQLAVPTPEDCQMDLKECPVATAEISLEESCDTKIDPVPLELTEPSEMSQPTQPSVLVPPVQFSLPPAQTSLSTAQPSILLLPRQNTVPVPPLQLSESLEEPSSRPSVPVQVPTVLPSLPSVPGPPKQLSSNTASPQPSIPVPAPTILPSLRGITALPTVPVPLPTFTPSVTLKRPVFIKPGRSLKGEKMSKLKCVEEPIKPQIVFSSPIETDPELEPGVVKEKSLLPLKEVALKMEAAKAPILALQSVLDIRKMLNEREKQASATSRSSAKEAIQEDCQEEVFSDVEPSTTSATVDKHVEAKKKEFEKEWKDLKEIEAKKLEAEKERELLKEMMTLIDSEERKLEPEIQVETTKCLEVNPTAVLEDHFGAVESPFCEEPASELQPEALDLTSASSSMKLDKIVSTEKPDEHFEEDISKEQFSLVEGYESINLNHDAKKATNVIPAVTSMSEPVTPPQSSCETKLELKRNDTMSQPSCSTFIGKEESVSTLPCELSSIAGPLEAASSLKYLNADTSEEEVEIASDEDFDVDQYILDLEKQLNIKLVDKKIPTLHGSIMEITKKLSFDSLWSFIDPSNVKFSFLEGNFSLVVTFQKFRGEETKMKVKLNPVPKDCPASKTALAMGKSSLKESKIVLGTRLAALPELLEKVQEVFERARLFLREYKGRIRIYCRTTLVVHKKHAELTVTFNSSLRHVFFFLVFRIEHASYPNALIVPTLVEDYTEISEEIRSGVISATMEVLPGPEYLTRMLGNVKVFLRKDNPPPEGLFHPSWQY